MELNIRLHAPVPLSPGRGPPVPIEQKAGWSPSLNSNFNFVLKTNCILLFYLVKLKEIIPQTFSVEYICL
jgi:hypothetical protein